VSLTLEEIEAMNAKVTEQRCWQEKGVAAIETVMERPMTPQERAGVYKTHAVFLRAGFRGEPLAPDTDQLAELLWTVGAFYGQALVPEDEGVLDLVRNLGDLKA
jgi:hypothetical protein